MPNKVMAGRKRKMPKKRCEGFTLLEFGVVAIILGILAAILLDRLLFYQEAAEKARMESTVATLKSALRLKIVALMVQERTPECARLAQQDPMDWLESKPSDYLGEYRGAPPESVVRDGGWYYDGAAHILVYRVNNGRLFVPDSSGQRQVRFRITRLADDLRDSRDACVFLLNAPILTPVEPYRWL